MIHLALDYIRNHGYLALLMLQALGVLALPLPDEVLVTFAGYLCYRGDLHLGLTITTAFFGASLGITLSYLLGRFLGPGMTKFLGRWLHLTPERLAQGNQWFQRAGKWSLTFGYFIPGVRHVIGFTAGTLKLPLGLFWVYACSGALIWSGAFAVLGFCLGDQWARWAPKLSMIAFIPALLIGIVVAVILWLRRHR